MYAKDLSNGEFYPFEFRVLGLSYEAFNNFFNKRVVRWYAQDLRMYLDTMGLKYYDFDALIKKMNGWDAIGCQWVKFENMGAKCWEDIQTQSYPIY